MAASGQGSASHSYDRILGLPLELIPDQNPAEFGPTGPFVVRLVYDDKPLSAATIVAVHRDRPQRLLKATTDSQGRASFPLDRTGVWMFTAIHMVRAPRQIEADWESFWASLTLEMAKHAGTGRE